MLADAAVPALLALAADLSERNTVISTVYWSCQIMDLLQWQRLLWIYRARGAASIALCGALLFCDGQALICTARVDWALRRFADKHRPFGDDGWLHVQHPCLVSAPLPHSSLNAPSSATCADTSIVAGLLLQF